VTVATSFETHAREVARRAIRVRGTVQGVGFRPFVWRLAQELALDGSVRNDAAGVAIEVQGGAAALELFVARLGREAPALARIDSIECSPLPPAAPRGFAIAASRAGRSATAVGADSAICDACLEDLFDPRNRRYRYAFTHCTHCGPRYTITRALPYDRPHTSMARFALCERCGAEHEDPRDRRFHAQANCCPDCGPRLAWLDGRGAPLAQRDAGGAPPAWADPIAALLGCIRDGGIAAVKGIGGYHLVCDATNAAAVARLRARKAREEKPFALMLANAASLAAYAEVSEAERALLESRERPIVLLRKGPECGARLPGIAPGLPWLGAMLPYAPLHYLLFHEAAGRPEGRAWLEAPQPLALVATSANPGGEPLVTGETEASAKLAGIADAFLVHDREIVVRCDDSLVRAAANGAPAFLRRGRGYTPRPIKLAQSGPAVLATGAYLKNAVCVTRGDEAFLSQHVGDLDNAATRVALEGAIAHLLDVLQVEPERVAHDLHPDFHSTRFAARFASERGIACIAVQHHHAHIAAVAAEHRREGPLLGLALDGVGLGKDGSAWGGELLLVDGAKLERLGHLAPLALPGGDRAAREPWRMAAALLHALGRGAEIARRFAEPAAAQLARLLERGTSCPPTTSAGRWFDAAAGVLGIRARSAYEGQAAMLLEGAAAAHGPVAPLEDGFRLREDGVLDLLPLGAALLDERDAGRGAALFHATLACALAEWAKRSARANGIDRVALGGGCFMNRVLTGDLRRRLEAAGLEVLEAREAPPNDGGLALGQAAVALAAEGT
jgi:hydrogenase maturation protein HypF